MSGWQQVLDATCRCEKPRVLQEYAIRDGRRILIWTDTICCGCVRPVAITGSA